MALNASPDGSTPTAARTLSMPASDSARPYVSGFEIDCNVNGTLVSPAS